MSGRSSIWLPHLALAVVCSAIALLSNSCARAVKMSVVEPANLVSLPAEHDDSRRPSVTRRDSIATRDDGLLVVRSDSLTVYSRAQPAWTALHDSQPGHYRLKRSARSLRVLGFVPAGEHWREWEGDLRVSGDSLEFLRRAVPARGLRRGFPAETLRTSPQAIARVDLEQADIVHTVVVVTVFTVVILGIAAVSLAAGLEGAN